MNIAKVCKICGKEFIVPHWRENAKYCSAKCVGLSLRAKNNMVCSICGKPFHLKQSRINRNKGDLGFCCSKKCKTEQIRIRMSGSGNHQFGLKGYLNSGFKKHITQVKNHKLTESMVYVGSWHKKNKKGRIKEYRFLVEACHTLFPDIYFEEIDGWFYLKDGYSVHHKDFNHENNSIFNLEILTRSEHSSLHNKLRNTPRNNKGQFVKHL